MGNKMYTSRLSGSGSGWISSDIWQNPAPARFQKMPSGASLVTLLQKNT